MEEPETQTRVDAGAPEADDIDWQAGLLYRVRWVVVLLIGLGGAATLAGFRSDPMRIFGIILMVYSLVLIGLLWTPRLSARIKTVLIIATLAVASVTAYLIAGYLPGGALTAAFMLLLAALLIGRKTFIVLLFVFTLFLIGLTVAVATGMWQGPNPIDVDPADPTNWFRTGLVAVLLWACIGFSVIFVVNTIEQNLSRRKAALISLREENAARREAESIAFHAQKMEAVGQLAAGVAHDVNNALLVIQSWNEMRGDLDADDSQREATQAIEDAVDRGAELSRQLLTFARKDMRSPKDIYLDRLVSDAEKTLRNLVGSDIALTIDCEPDLLIHADEGQVHQLILNLCLNARDALKPSGNIEIRVAAATRDIPQAPDAAASDWVALEVSDDGPGIDEAMQRRVFEPFFTTKEPGKGTGLGLSTVYGIAQQSGGHVDLVSEPGRTTFSVYFPALRAQP